MSALELVLLALVAIQGARLVWALLTPVGPVGDWKAPAFFTAPSSSAELGSFDPFFRLDSGGSAVVTSLDLKLYGVREDRATGRGSAIIALPDGRQLSFAVGDEIMPGVILAEVGFDSVTINRQGSREQIFLDQSTAAETVGGPGEAGGGTPPPPQAPPAISAPGPSPIAPPPLPGQPIQFQPRTVNGRVSGAVDISSRCNRPASGCAAAAAGRGFRVPAPHLHRPRERWPGQPGRGFPDFPSRRIRSGRRHCRD